MIVVSDAVSFLSEQKKTALRVTELMLKKSRGVGKRMDMLILVFRKIGVERFESFCAWAPDGDGLIQFAQMILHTDP